MKGLRLFSSYQDAVGIDVEATEFEWKNVTGFSSLSVLEKNPRRLEDAENPVRRVQGPDHLHVNVQ